MEEYQKKDFGKLLKAGALEGRRWMRATDSEAVRIYDRNLEGLPLTVELFGPYARVTDYSDEGLDERDCEEVVDLINRMVYIEREKIILTRKKKREGIEQHTGFSAEPLAVTVKENGLSFNTELRQHVDTGLFLDLVNVRQMVRETAMGLKVLNLFSYTGSFSVYAASGGAEEVVSVDMSNTYSAVARRNLIENGFLSEEKYPVIVEDATGFLKRAVEEKKMYDLIIFDPPSFSNSHKMEKPFDINKDHLEWICNLNKLLPMGGILIFCVNLSTFHLEKKYLKSAFKVNEITNEMKAQGFSLKKGGSARVFLLEKVDRMRLPQVRKAAYRMSMEEIKDSDLERLVLSADDEGKPEKREKRREEKKPSYGEKSRGRSEERRDSRPRRERDERRSYDDRPRYRDDDRRRSYSDRDERDSRRSYGEERDRRSYDSRESRRYYDSPRSRYDDGDGRRYDERRSYDTGSRRSYSDGQSDRRRYDERSERRYDERSSYGRRYDDRRNDRPRYRDEERSDRHGSKDRKAGSVKPYGYDTFRNSRGRNKTGSEDFFWRDDKKEKKEEE